MRGAALVPMVAACSFRGPLIGDAAQLGDAAAQVDGPIAIDAPADAGPSVDARVCAGPCYRRAIAIAGSSVTAALTDFPLLVSLASDAGLRDHARANGFDIAFEDAAGTQLAYERQAYASATGKLVAWVHLPTLAASTTIYMTYGNAQVATDQQQPIAAWPASYRGVWHLEEPTGTLHDATQNHSDATAANGLQLAATGVIGTGVRFGGIATSAGLYPQLAVPDSGPLQPLVMMATLSAWLEVDVPAAGRYQTILTSGNAPNDGFSWTFQADGDYYFYPWAGNTNDVDLVTNPIAATTWHHVAVTLDYGAHSVILYIDGVPATNAMTGVTMANWTSPAGHASWLWGWNAGFGTQPGDLVGGLDEIRVESIVRPAPFIKATFANQRSPGTFYTLGAEEAL